MGNKKIYWRKDITGLRALAVIPVLFFHAFPDILPGGFFGVDVFFVISGYLISGIIFRKILKDDFSYLSFYEKRIRRIVPNLLCILIFVSFIGYFLLSSNEYVELGKQISASALFYQNFELLKSVDDYFAVSAIQKPLLHLWSLAIEEQFYIVFPILCWLSWKIFRSKKIIALLVISIFIASLLSCLVISDKKFDFYFPLTRFWEIGLGILVAFVEILVGFRFERLNIYCRNILSIIGFSFILLSIIFYGRLGVPSPSPGAISLMPTIGATLLILSREDAWVNRTVLSWRIMVFIGLLSYSLYLWHWPFLSYLYFLQPNAESWQVLMALVMSFFVSVFIYVLIENPIRRLDNKIIVVLLLILLVFCFALGKVIRLSNGLPNRPMAKELIGFTQWPYPDGLVLNKDLGAHVYATSSEQFPEILLLGDSHMEMYAERVKLLSKKTGKNAAFITSGACLALAGVADWHPEKCEPLPEIINKLLADRRVKTVVIGQMWGSYYQKHPEELVKTLANLRENIKINYSDKKFYILLDVPWGGRDYELQSYVSRLSVATVNNYMVPYPSEVWWKKGNQIVEKYLANTVKFLSGESYVCHNYMCNLVYYKDGNHLKPAYVESHGVWIDEVFRN